MPTGPPQQKMLSAELAADIAGDAEIPTDIPWGGTENYCDPLDISFHPTNHYRYFISLGFFEVDEVL